jgi:dephospho-CoA kinase
LRIGLTGGIASGKTTVAALFAELGVPVIDTDTIAREVVSPGQPALAEIVETFGTEVLGTGGQLDRSALRRLIFADTARRRQLEAILHPRIRAETLARADACRGPYHVIVVPLLLETGFASLVDRVLVVDCPESTQRVRLAERDHESAEQIERIIGSQIARDARLQAADDVIDNAGSLTDTRRQVEALHRSYLDLARPHGA